MDPDIPQLFESIREKVGTAERAQDLVNLLAEAFDLGPKPLVAYHCSKCFEYIGCGPGDAHICGEPVQYEWRVRLIAAGPLPVNIMKAMRGLLPGMLLVDAKDIVVNAPSIITEGIGKEQAEDIKRKLQALGAVVEVT